MPATSPLGHNGGFLRAAASRVEPNHLRVRQVKGRGGSFCKGSTAHSPADATGSGGKRFRMSVFRNEHAFVGGSERVVRVSRRNRTENLSGSLNL